MKGTPRVSGTCRYCGAGITRKFGFWSLWRNAESEFKDPKYCPSSPIHVHAPEG